MQIAPRSSPAAAFQRIVLRSRLIDRPAEKARATRANRPIVPTALITIPLLPHRVFSPFFSARKREREREGERERDRGACARAHAAYKSRAQERRCKFSLVKLERGPLARLIAAIYPRSPAYMKSVSRESRRLPPPPSTLSRARLALPARCEEHLRARAETMRTFVYLRHALI